MSVASEGSLRAAGAQDEPGFREMR